MQDDPFINYRYLNDGRVVQAQCSSAALRIEAGVAEPLTPDDAEIYGRYSGVSPAEPEEPAAPLALVESEPEVEAEPEPEAAAPVALEEPEPEPAVPEEGEAPQGAQDGWPDGYTWLRSGPWYTVTSPDGDAVGKFKGKGAAQEGAWTYEAGRPRGEE